MLGRILRRSIRLVSERQRSGVCACGKRSYADTAAEPTKAKTASDLAAEAEDSELMKIEAKSPAKGLFINKIDHASLIFPEFVETEDVNSLEASVEQIENFFEQNVDSAAIDKDAKVPEDVISGLKKMRLFGAFLPREYGGLQLCEKEHVRLAEVMGRDLSIFSTWSVHDLVCYAVEKHGTDHQKAKYLSRLASGELLGAFCLAEEGSGFDSAAMECVCTGMDIQELNGTKTWVTNGKDADLLLVFAKNPGSLGSYESQEVPLTTAYLVDRTEIEEGITPEYRIPTLGLNGAEFWKMKFKQVMLSSDAVLGSAGLGFEMAQEIMESQRHSFGAAVVGLMKKLLVEISAHCNVVKRYDLTLSDNPSIRRRVADLALETYLVETMTYYVAGSIDENPEKDVEIEGAIVNRSAKKLLTAGLVHAMEIMGAQSYQADSELSRIFRDAMTLSSFLTCSDVLTDQIALIGLSTWADEFGQELPKIRNPSLHPWYTWKKKLVKRSGFENPKLIHFIQESVHPSLEDACRGLEESMARFESVFAGIIEHHGKDVQFESYILERLTNVATHLFAMITVIARTSRSYSIGLRNADTERVWADGYCSRASREVKETLADLAGELDTVLEDKVMDKISAAIFELKGYPIESPLKRNW